MASIQERETGTGFPLPNEVTKGTNKICETLVFNILGIKQKKQKTKKTVMPQTNKQKNSDAYKTGTRRGQLCNCPNSLP